MEQLTDAQIIEILKEARHHPDMRADDTTALEHLKTCPSAKAVRLAYEAGLKDGRG